MNGWKRITLVICVLVGGTASFGYWTINQFNQAFDDLSASSVANTLTASASFKKDASLASVSTTTATTSTTTAPASKLKLATSLVLTTTPATFKPKLATSTDLGLSFTFPQTGDRVYIGCTYEVSWKSSTVINSLETVLVDAGTRDTMGPVTSGLAKENTIETDSQNLKWKVGVVWPGSYYIKVSKINGAKAEFRSKVFEISKMPKGIDEEEKINICLESSS